MISCPHCPRNDFAGQGALDEHMRQRHGHLVHRTEQIKTDDAPQPVVVGPYFCGECGRDFPTDRGLQVHWARTHGPNANGKQSVPSGNVVVERVTEPPFDPPAVEDEDESVTVQIAVTLTDELHERLDAAAWIYGYQDAAEYVTAILEAQPIDKTITKIVRLRNEALAEANS